MAGIQSKLIDLGKSFEKLKAGELGAEISKREMLTELKRGFQKQGFSPWMAEKLAGEKYNQIHKH